MATLPNFETQFKPLRLYHPLDYLRLLYWVYFRPSLLRGYTAAFCPEGSEETVRAKLTHFFRNRAVRSLFIQGILLAYVLSVGTYFLTIAITGEAFEWNNILGVAYGVASGMAVGVAFGVVLGVAVGMAVGVAFGVAIGTAYGVVGGVIFGVAVGMVVGVTLGVVLGVALGVFFSVFLGVAAGVASGVVSGVAAGMAVGVVLGMVYGVVLGVAVGVATVASSIRFPFYLLYNAPSAIWQYLRAKSGRRNRMACFLRSPAHRDELQVIPQPYLADFLLLTLKENLGNGLWAIHRILHNPFQRWTSQKAFKRFISASPNKTFEIFNLILTEPLFQKQIGIRRIKYPANIILLSEIANRRTADLPMVEGLVFRLNAPFRDKEPTAITSLADFYFQLLTQEKPYLTNLLPLLEGVRSFQYGEEIYQYFQLLSSCERCESLQDINGIPIPEADGKTLPLPPFTPETTIQGLRLLGEIVQEVRVYHTASSWGNRLRALNRATAALQRLREHIDAMTEPETRVVLQIVERWSSLFGAESAKEGEIPREPVENPYVAGEPVSGTLFVGRDDVFREVEELWNVIHTQPSIIIYGHRRMGKSSILRNLGGHFSGDTQLVYADMQRMQARSTEGLLFAIAREIYRSIPTTDEKLQEPQLNDFQGEPYLQFNSFLGRVENVLGEKRLVLAIDEYELLAERIQSGILDKDLLWYLRGLMQGTAQLTLVFAGLHTQEQMMRDYSHEFWGSARTVKVSYLERQAAERLITNPTEDFRIDYDEDAVDCIIKMTNRQPYLIQQICFDLVRQLNNRIRDDTFDDKFRIHLSDVKAVIAEQLTSRDADYYFSGVWNQIESETDKRLLHTMAQSDQAWSLSEITAQVGPSEDGVIPALERMEGLDVLDSKTVDGRKCWEFQVELMREWIKSRRETNLT